MGEAPNQLSEQLKAAKEMLRQLEESLAKTQRLIEQTRQILNQAGGQTNCSDRPNETA